MLGCNMPHLGGTARLAIHAVCASSGSRRSGSDRSVRPEALPTQECVKSTCVDCNTSHTKHLSQALGSMTWPKFCVHDAGNAV